jgi:hypothetical protein
MYMQVLAKYKCQIKHCFKNETSAYTLQQTTHNSGYKFHGGWCMGCKALMALYIRVMIL